MPAVRAWRVDRVSDPLLKRVGRNCPGQGRSQLEFVCHRGGHAGHADVNAAKNTALRAAVSYSRLSPKRTSLRHRQAPAFRRSALWRNRNRSSQADLQNGKLARLTRHFSEVISNFSGTHALIESLGIGIGDNFQRLTSLRAAAIQGVRE